MNSINAKRDPENPEIQKRVRAIFSQFLAVNARAQTKVKVFFVLTRQLESETIGTIREFTACSAVGNC